MESALRVASTVLGFALLLAASMTAQVQAPSPDGSGGAIEAARGLRFVANEGQWETSAAFVARSGKLTIRVAADALLLQLDERPGHPGRGALVRLVFEGGSPSTELHGFERLPGVHHYLLGTDPGRWRRDVPGYAAVHHAGLYPEVAVQLSGRGGLPGYDLELAEPAQADWVVIRCEGAQALRLEANDALILDTTAGPITLASPRGWRVLPTGEREALRCRYRVIDATRFGFQVAGAVVEAPRVADAVLQPELQWSTYVGESDYDGAHGGMVTTPDGRSILFGDTASLSFPVTPGAFDTTFAGGETIGCECDAYVTCLDSTGSSLVFSTFIGGTRNEQPYDVSLGPNGDIYVTGWTSSYDYPTTQGAFKTTKIFGTDTFVSRLTADGSALVYSTFLGASANAQVIVVDPQGEAVVCGSTASSTFPTTSGAYDTEHAGNSDWFVTRLTADGTGLVFSTLMGGAASESVWTGLIEPDGSVLVGGSGWDLPTTPGSFQPVPPEDGGCVILRLSADGSTVLASTFLAGYSSERPRALALGPGGEVIVGGETHSGDFPTTPGAFQPVLNTFFGPSGFVSCLDKDLSTLHWSTFINGARSVHIGAMHVDSAGTVTLAGTTNSSNFPTTPGAYSMFKKGASHEDDVFVSRLSADGSTMYYSTFFGGTLHDSGPATGGLWHTLLGVGPLGTVTIGGVTFSTDLPVTPGAYQTALAGETDAFVTRFDPLPSGVSQYGDSTPGCRGPIAIGVTAMPQYGSTKFAITSTNAAPGASAGLLGLSLAALAVPVQGAGTQVWVDPRQLVALLPVAANAKGFALVPLRLEGSPALVGLSGAAQFFWRDECGPAGWAASNALKLAIQP